MLSPAHIFSAGLVLTGCMSCTVGTQYLKVQSSASPHAELTKVTSLVMSGSRASGSTSLSHTLCLQTCLTTGKFQSRPLPRERIL